MSIKMIGASLAAASLVALPLAACGSSTAPTAPTATTVTAMATAPSSTSSSSCTISNGYANWESCWKAEQRQHPTTTPAATPTAAPAPAHQNGGLPWWAWVLIVPVVLIALAVLGFKLAEANDERRVAKAWAKVDELDARHRARFGDDDDVEDYPEDDDELDELPAEDMAFLHRATDPAPSAPAQPAPPAGGSLLSSLRQQGGDPQ